MRTKVKCPKCGCEFMATWDDVGSDVGNYSLPNVPECACGMPVGPEDAIQRFPRARKALKAFKVFGWTWGQLTAKRTCPWFHKREKPEYKTEAKAEADGNDKGICSGCKALNTSLRATSLELTDIRRAVGCPARASLVSWTSGMAQVEKTFTKGLEEAAAMVDTFQKREATAIAERDALQKKYDTSVFQAAQEQRGELLLAEGPNGDVTRVQCDVNGRLLCKCPDCGAEHTTTAEDVQGQGHKPTSWKPLWDAEEEDMDCGDMGCHQCPLASSSDCEEDSRGWEYCWPSGEEGEGEPEFKKVKDESPNPTEWKPLGDGRSVILRTALCKGVCCTDHNCPADSKRAPCQEHSNQFEHRWPSGIVGKGKPEFRKVSEGAKAGDWVRVECPGRCSIYGKACEGRNGWEGQAGSASDDDKLTVAGGVCPLEHLCKIDRPEGDKAMAQPRLKPEDEVRVKCKGCEHARSGFSCQSDKDRDAVVIGDSHSGMLAVRIPGRPMPTSCPPKQLTPRDWRPEVGTWV